MNAVCPHCGAPSPAQARFCMHCGREPAPAAGPRRSPLLLWTATLLAAVVLGGGATAAVLHLRDGGGAPAATGSPAPDPAGPSPSASPAAGATASEATAPPGHVLVHDPAGFSFAVPEGWGREGEENGQITYAGPTGAESFLIGVQDRPQTSTYENYLAIEKATRKNPDRPGYRRQTLERTTFQGRPAALWVYSYDTEPAGHRVEARSLGYIAEDGREYVVQLMWRTGPQGDFMDGEGAHRAALDTWSLGG